MTDPVRLRTTRLRDRPLIYVLCVIVGVAVVSTAILIASVHHESTARTGQLQDAFCGTDKVKGLLPTILQAPVTAQTSPLGRQIIAGARHAAEIVHCPGIR